MCAYPHAPSLCQSRGDFLGVGDLMRSISLLTFRRNEESSKKGEAVSVEEIGREYSANWMTALEMYDDSTLIGAEHNGNLLTVQKNMEATTDEERVSQPFSSHFPPCPLPRTEQYSRVQR